MEVEATLALFVLPFTEWSRGHLYELEVGIVGEIGADGGTLSGPDGRTRGQPATAFG
jgi:hypothetical protein